MTCERRKYINAALIRAERMCVQLMKNVLFFLTPKNDVAYIKDTFTIRQALENMRNHNYTAIPVISENGKYVGTITEGDFLWAVYDTGGGKMRDIETHRVSELERRHDNIAVSTDAAMESLVQHAMNQNFVPVVTDDGIFIGIVTRKAIIEYYAGVNRAYAKGEAK